MCFCTRSQVAAHEVKTTTDAALCTGLHKVSWGVLVAQETVTPVYGYEMTDGIT